MKSLHLARAAAAALIGVALAHAPAHAEIKNYEFQLVQPTVKAGADRVVSVRLLDKSTGKAVSDAVIFSTRLDMAPDGMQEMATKVTPMQSTEPGTYRFKATFGMAGRWQLSLGAKVQGETGSVESKLVVTGRAMSSRAMRPLIWAGAAAAIAAVAGAAWTARGLPPRPATAAIVSAVQAAESAAPIYYRDPDGKPLYSATPKQTPDGRDYLPVFPEADAQSGEPEQPANAKSAAAKSERKVKYYRNPMGLADTSPVPKKDSMGMDYIPVYDGEDSDDGSITLSPGKIQRTGVKSEAALMRRIRTLVRAPGTIQLDERRVSVIAMRAEGYVQKVADVTTGSRVTRGQPLMEVYSPAISSAAAEYVATITSKATAGIEPYGRGSKQRLTNLDVPEAVIADMEKSRTVPIAIPWSSPRDGIVLQRAAIEGMRAQPGDVLFRIADVSVVWALVDVAERDLGNIGVGQDVTVRARSYPGRAFAGKISMIYPQVNKETRTARVRIELENADLALLPDMYVDAEIDTGSAAPVLTVADNSILDTGSRQTVLLDRGNGRFEPREVKLGRRGDGYVEIRDGIAEGDAVVTSATFLIDAESNLKAAIKGFAEAGAKQAAGGSEMMDGGKP